MLPTEQFSGDATKGPAWTPQVWRDGPDQLVNQAQLALFQDRADIEVGALGPRETAASMDGQVNQGANEWEESINPSQPPEGQGRATQWKASLDKMRAVDELAGQVKSTDYDPSPGQANPAP